MPPKPEEVAAFEKDASPAAYAKLVESLLKNPHYGERMAIGWLDVVRFEMCIRDRLPPGITADPAFLEGSVPAKSRQSFKIKLTANPAQILAGVQMVPMDITLDGRHYGQLFDFIIQAKEPEKKETPQ